MPPYRTLVYPRGRVRGVSCDSCGTVLRLVTDGSRRNRTRGFGLAHVVEPDLGFPYI